MGYKWDISNIILMEDSWDTPRGKQPSDTQVVNHTSATVFR
jgi:hypothetical protein